MRETGTRRRIAVVSVVALLCLPAGAAAQCYTDAPGLLTANIDRILKGWTADGAIVSATADELGLMALLDAIAGIGQARAAALLVETADTSKQVGASSRASGSTSLVERPNPVKFLAMAVEHGAVVRSQTGTRLTLSTSPYAWLAWRYGDTDRSYEEFDFFTRLGFSFGFDVDSENASVEDITRGQLREISGRFRFTPDRSARSAEFARMWEDQVRQAVTEHLLSITAPISSLLDDPEFRPLARSFEDQYRARTKDMADVQAVRGIILCELHSQIVMPVRERRVNVTEAHRTAARSAVARVGAAQLRLLEARERVDAYFREIEGKAQASLSVSYHRPATGTTFSEYKLVFERKAFSPMKLVLNGGLSVYHDPAAALNQETIKDISVSAALELARWSPFLSNSLSMDRATLAIAGRFERAREKNGILQERQNFGVLQIKVDLPVSTGLNIPISFTMGTTPQSVAGEKKTARQKSMHFGLTFDSDKLLALAKARALAAAGQ